MAKCFLNLWTGRGYLQTLISSSIILLNLHAELNHDDLTKITWPFHALVVCSMYTFTNKTKELRFHHLSTVANDQYHDCVLR